MMLLSYVGSSLDLIGNTSLVKLRHISTINDAEIYVKTEYLNPSGSLKDRIAIEMIRDAEEQGKLKPGNTIIEASTGNTGTALSFVGRQLGYNVEIYMPEGMTSERIKIMERYGANVHQLKLPTSMDGSIAGAEVEINTRIRCLEVENERPDVWWARQFSNPANIKAHLKTGNEIIEQLNDHVDVFVASIGVGGTLYGVALALKEKYSDCLIIGIEPASAKYPLSEGYTRVPGTNDEVCGGIIEEMMLSGIVDEIHKVTNNEAISMTNRLLREEGLFCGVSSGANVHIALKFAKKLGPSKKIVTVLPDSHDRYLSEMKYTT
jgi:cysteine synthase A